MEKRNLVLKTYVTQKQAREAQQKNKEAKGTKQKVNNKMVDKLNHINNCIKCSRLNN